MAHPTTLTARTTAAQEVLPLAIDSTPTVGITRYAFESGQVLVVAGIAGGTKAQEVPSFAICTRPMPVGKGSSLLTATAPARPATG